MNIVVGYNDNRVVPQSRPICRYYQRGACRFGHRCRNAHSNTELSDPVEMSKVPEQTLPTIKTSPEKTPTVQPLRLSLATDNSNKDMETENGAACASSSTIVTASLSAMACGICFDTIMEKQNRREQTFGILPNCNHCFCFTCIRKWRQTKEFDFDVSKACPECRKPSDYVYPSKIWFEIKEEKDSFISKEKLRMQSIDCRYFQKGKGSCPFGNTCLYLHALPNGKKMDVGPPRPRRRRTSNIDNDMLYQILYWLNDEEPDMDDDDDDDMDADSELDLDDPLIAMQYYDHDDFRRYVAIDRLMNPGSDTESEDLDFPLFFN